MKMTTWLCLTSAMLLNLSLCSDDKEIEEQPDTGGSGKGEITLSAGGEEYKISGNCGWAAAGGAKYIGLQDANNPLKTFSIFFNVEDIPKSTTSFDLVADVLDEDPKHVTMNITEIKGGSMFEYRSTDASGKVTLEVNGNSVKVNLNGVKLKPTTTNPIYTSLNTGAFSKEGTLKGTLIFTK